MSENKQSIRAGLQADGHSRDITGHDLMDIARFSDETRHMIVFDVAWIPEIGQREHQVLREIIEYL